MFYILGVFVLLGIIVLVIKGKFEKIENERDFFKFQADYYKEFHPDDADK